MPKLIFKKLKHNIVLKDSDDPSFIVRRAKIPGEWLIQFYEYDYASGPRYHQSAWGYGFGGITFIPDPKHEWDGGSLP